MTNAVWENGFAMPEFPELNHNLKTDVLIVGGGGHRTGKPGGG